MKGNLFYIELEEKLTTLSDKYFPAVNVLIGKDTTIGAGTKIFRNVTIMKNVNIGDNCIIGNNSMIREHCNIGNNNKIGFSNALEPKISMGDNNRTQGFCMIAEHSCIGSNNFFGPHFNSTGDKTIGLPKEPYVANPAIIGNDCRFGTGTRLVPGIIIANKTVTGGMSLVTKNTQEDSLYYGVPAKLIKENYSKEVN